MVLVGAHATGGDGVEEGREGVNPPRLILVITAFALRRRNPPPAFRQTP